MVSVPSPSPFLRPSPHSRISFTRSTPSPSCVSFRRPPCAAITVSAERTRSNCLCPPKLTASFYDVLGIPKVATSQEIKAAYRRLARVCHPDAAAENRKDSLAEEFMKIPAAYSTPSDPDKRAVYDRKISHRLFVSYSRISPSPTTETPGFSGYTRQNWDTDQCW